MARIFIQGWASFDEWRKAGYPGAVNCTLPTPVTRYYPPPKPRCSVPSCDRTGHARGLCYLHYERQRIRARATGVVK